LQEIQDISQISEISSNVYWRVNYSDRERSTRTSFTRMNKPYWNKYRYSYQWELGLEKNF